MHLCLHQSGRERGGDTTRGFSLIELIVVVALVGILAAVAVPSLKAWIDDARTSAYATRLVSGVAVARSAALKFGTPVVLCASADGASCGGAWRDGWIVFRDDDDDADVTGGEPLLLGEREADAAATVGMRTGTGTSRDWLAFDYRGYPDAAVAVKVERGEAVVTVAINAIGQALAVGAADGTSPE